MINEFKEMLEMANSIEFAQRKRFCLELQSSGLDIDKYSVGPNFWCEHPTEERSTILFDVQDCWFNESNDYNGYWHFEVAKEAEHSCWECQCDSNCDGTHTVRRPATQDEMEYLIFKWFDRDYKFHSNRIEQAELLPVIETLDVPKIRRRIEDRLRKSEPQTILKVANLLETKLD